MKKCKTDKNVESKNELITIELDENKQENIKAAAASEGLSVQEYILMAVNEKMISSYQRINDLPDDRKPYMPHSADEEVFTPGEEAYIFRIMKENHVQIPTVGEFDRLSDETQMHTTQRLLIQRKNAIERLMIRRDVEEVLG